MLDVAEVHNKIEQVQKPDVDLGDKTIPVIAVSDNVHCPNIPPNATQYIGSFLLLSFEIQIKLDHTDSNTKETVVSKFHTKSTLVSLSKRKTQFFERIITVPFLAKKSL